MPESSDPRLELRILGRETFGERVDPGAGVRVDVPIRFVLQAEMAKHLDDDRVLEHIGVIARVKGVTITEHDDERPATAIESGEENTSNEGRSF